MKVLEKLETFLVLAECGSYTEAAKKMYCSQPTISNHIQQLEEHYQTKLIERRGKKAELTEQGEIVLEYARKLTCLIAESETMVRKSQQKQERIMSLYVSNYISEYFFGRILSHYHGAYPSQLLEIYTYCYSDLRTALLEGKADFAFLPLYDDSLLAAEFDAVPLFEEELVFVISPSHPWKSRKMIYKREFSRQTILLPSSPFICSTIKQELQEHAQARFLQMSNFGTIKQSVQAGIGTAFLPYEAVRSELETGQLLTIPIASLQLIRSNGLVVRKGKRLSEAEYNFCGQVRQFFSQYYQRPAPVQAGRTPHQNVPAPGAS
ncbi:LysR family transcriptional regulator [Paenibacillus protaetiae]|uniref:LysR family transcriptional regulator n=1 Tax=Paenibacillus protaetiae TaxID=2509456 RepID=A0A4P6EXG1_9BACL|nr:LysR family transcriptional regulator [Paenibacillus protaetiae]QAY67446.1 LysR family transcriptional regulator [Paenibacillus protaetiae]